MKMMLVVVSLIWVIISGCSIYHIDSKDISLDYHPSKRSSNDVVYIEKVSKPYTVIGYVTVNTERRHRISDIIDKMKREAAIMGGDAITDIKTDATGIWKRLPAQHIIGNAYIRANFTAKVIIFDK